MTKGGDAEFTALVLRQSRFVFRVAYSADAAEDAPRALKIWRALRGVLRLIAGLGRCARPSLMRRLRDFLQMLLSRCLLIPVQRGL